MNPLAISGTRRAIKELVDGTIRVQVDIDPDCRAAFFALFLEIDTRVALAPLRSEAKSMPPKGGELARTLPDQQTGCCGEVGHGVSEEA